MKYNIQIDITLYNETHDIHELARSFPHPPDVISERGSRNTERIIPRNSYVSFCSSAKSWDAGLEKHWDNLFDRVAINRKRLVELSDVSKIKITIVVDHKGRFPALYFPNKFISFAAEIGADLDIDVYEENMDEL